MKGVDSLKILKDGWYEGGGVAFDKVDLNFIADQLVCHYPKTLPIPAIIPTPEGNLLFEWDSENNPSLDIELQSKDAYFHAFFPGGKDIEKEFNLSNQQEWHRLFSFLQEVIL